jgi:hypothetical protein
MKSLGFTFDEKILNQMSLEAFFDEFPIVDALEIAPDNNILTTNDYKKIISYTKNHNYHVPYFVSEMKYDFSSEYYKNDYSKFLSIIESLRQYSVKTPSMITHGATVLTNRLSAFESTKRGIDYLLNFIEQKNMDVIISLESIQSPYIGHTSELLEIYNLFNHNKLQLCYDIHHVKVNEMIIPSNKFLEAVNYVHLHDDHGSIMQVEKEWFPTLKAHYNLELLLPFCDNYRETLKNDIEYIRTI